MISTITVVSKIKQEVILLELIVGNPFVEDLCMISRAYSLLHKRRKIALVDAQVYALYKKILFNGKNHFFGNAKIVCLPAGERAKSIQTLTNLFYVLKQLKSHRDADVIIAVGGGSTLDCASLCASLFQRGLPLIHVPTTLIGMIDATIGGKTAVNAFGLKNLVGSYYPPSVSLIDVKFLSTLTIELIREGLVEAVKIGFLSGELNFEKVAKLASQIQNNDEMCVKKLVQLSLKLKSNWVRMDFNDLSMRRELNFGHTLGHALEAMKNFRGRHGEAVGVGILFACKLSQLLGITEAESIEKLRQTIISLGIKVMKPSKLDVFCDELWQKIQMDKKHGERLPRFILPVKPGVMQLVEISKRQFLKASYAFFKQ